MHLDRFAVARVSRITGCVQIRAHSASINSTSPLAGGAVKVCGGKRGLFFATDSSALLVARRYIQSPLWVGGRCGVRGTAHSVISEPAPVLLPQVQQLISQALARKS